MNVEFYEQTMYKDTNVLEQTKLEKVRGQMSKLPEKRNFLVEPQCVDCSCFAVESVKENLFLNVIIVI